MNDSARWMLVTLLAAPWSALAAPVVSVFPLPDGSGPHDVAPAPDGGVWFTAQLAGALGRLDPSTGRVEEIPLGKGAAPHGVIIGPDGARRRPVRHHHDADRRGVLCLARRQPHRKHRPRDRRRDGDRAADAAPASVGRTSAPCSAIGITVAPPHQLGPRRRRANLAGTARSRRIA